MEEEFINLKIKDAICYLGFSENSNKKLNELYDSLISMAYGRVYDSRIHQKHHIVPRCFGGTDCESNLIYLTFEEHVFAHSLLAGMNTGGRRDAMIHAVCALTFFYTVKTSEEYEMAKKVKSVLLLGNNNAKNFPRTEEYRKKLSESKVGNKNTLGFVQTEEHKEKNRNAQIERFSKNPSSYFKLMERMVGNTYGKSNNGKKHSQEFRDKLSARMLGKKHAKGNKSKSKPVRCLDDASVYPSAKIAAEHYGLGSSKVTAVCRGRRKRTGGLRFEYA